MDQTDKRILQVLQTDGKLQNNELAQRIGLSASPCLRRVKQLEEDGIIRAYVALVDPAKGESAFDRVCTHLVKKSGSANGEPIC